MTDYWWLIQSIICSVNSTQYAIATKKEKKNFSWCMFGVFKFTEYCMNERIKLIYFGLLATLTKKFTNSMAISEFRTAAYLTVMKL